MDGLRFLKIPCCTNLSTPLEANSEIGIEAFFTKDGKKFKVMLLCDEDHKNADALLVLKVVDLNCIEVSHRQDGQSGDQQTIPVSDFLKWKELSLLISLETDHFKIILNGNLKTTFNYQFPLKTVNHIRIGGDIRLMEVTLPDQDDNEEEKEEEEEEEEKEEEKEKKEEEEDKEDKDDDDKS